MSAFISLTSIYFIISSSCKDMKMSWWDTLLSHDKSYIEYLLLHMYILKGEITLNLWKIKTIASFSVNFKSTKILKKE